MNHVAFALNYLKWHEMVVFSSENWELVSNAMAIPPGYAAICVARMNLSECFL